MLHTHEVDGSSPLVSTKKKPCNLNDYRAFFSAPMISGSAQNEKNPCNPRIAGIFLVSKGTPVSPKQPPSSCLCLLNYFQLCKLYNIKFHLSRWQFGIPERKHSVWLCGYSGRVLKESSDIASDRLKRMTMSIDTASLERGGQTGLQIDLTTHKCSGIVHI